MSRITSDMTFAQIGNLPGFAPLDDTFMECRPATKKKIYGIPLSELCPAWDHAGLERMLLGFSRLDEVVLSGKKCSWDVWDEPACAREPACRRVKLTHFPGRDGAPFVMICPGGGYNSVCSAMEGYYAAARLNERGYHAFVLTYRTREAVRMPAPIEDLAQALRLVEGHASEFSCGADYAVMGFSAGGHLAGMMGTARWGWRAWGLPAPRAMVLCYPVADLRTICGKAANPTVMAMLETMLGAKGAAEAGFDELASWSVTTGVDDEYPPTYLMQCADDDVVPAQNLLLMSQALTRCGIEHRAAVYARGGHGLQKPHGPGADRWMEGVLGFLAEQMPIGG